MTQTHNVPSSPNPTHMDCCSGEAISVKDAWTAIENELSDWGSEDCPLADSAGRVLSSNILTDRDQPPFNRVAMDGIAIEYSDWKDGIRQFPIEAVHQAGAKTPQNKSPHTCFEVMTGAVLPATCDCVIPYERISIEDTLATLPEDITLTHMQHVHQRASDQATGSVVLQSGTIMGPAEIAIAASMGAAHVRVYTRPSIGLITNGDELVEIDKAVEPWQIRQSNRPAGVAALTQHGYPVARSHHLPDDKAIISETISQELRERDIIILGGGVSKGKYDYIPECLEEQGVTKIFHRVHQRPGKPMWFGKGSSGQLIFALPGNPVSFLVGLYRYVLPALKTGSHHPDPHPPTAVLKESIHIKHGLAAFVPVTTQSDEHGTLIASPCQTKGSGDFCGLANTHGFIELQEGVSDHPKGLAVPFYEWTA